MRKALDVFYKAIADDGRIGVSHLSLYFSLLYTGGAAGEPFIVDRSSLMRLAKIHSLSPVI